MSQNSEKRTIRGQSLIGPAILIALGTVFLLNNLGVLAWSAWEVIIRLWPVLVIGVGLDLLIGRRSMWGALIALALTVIVFAGALWLVGANVGIERASATETIRHALQGAAEAEVTIAPGVGRLQVEALSESASLVDGTIALGRGERLGQDFTLKGEKAILNLRSEGTGFTPSVGLWRDQRNWDLGLASDVPLELEISMGVGQSDLDLTGLTLSSLSVSMGIGQTVVRLPDEGRFRAVIDGAIGETIIIVPAGMEARISLDTGLAASQMPSGYRRRDDVYTSSGYESASDRVDLEVSQAIGNVTIRHSAGR